MLPLVIEGDTVFFRFRADDFADLAPTPLDVAVFAMSDPLTVYNPATLQARCKLQNSL